MVVEISDLVKVYRRFRGPTTRALDGVSLHVEPGTIFGLLGPNGAGKSSMIKILLGISHPTSGTVRLLGAPAGDPASRRKVGYLPEAMRLPEWMKPPAFLQFMGQLSGMSRATAKRRAHELLELVGLQAHKKVLKELSKGMSQRLGLAQALLNDPDVLFLDEPTEGLDPIGRKDIVNLLLDLRRRGKTIFLNSHVLLEVERVCDRVIILNRGRVLRAGSLAEISTARNEFRISLARDGNDVRAVFSAALETKWVDAPGPGVTAIVRLANPGELPEAGRLRLNQLIDKLRALPVEIESVTPQRDSLEETFLQLVGGADA